MEAGMSSQSLDTVHNVSFSLDCHWVTLSKDPRFKYANSIRKFLKKMLNNFRRLARMTKNELSFEDLQSESWIVAHEISNQRGYNIDFSDVNDEQLLMRALNVRYVKNEAIGI
jgi:hypothetical protein